MTETKKERIAIPRKDVERYERCKEEYLHGGGNLRELADRYGVSYAALTKRSGRERWADQRRAIFAAAAPKVRDRAAQAIAERAERLFSTADSLTREIDGRMNGDDLLRTARDARDLAAALAELRDVLQIRTEEDVEEQRARIGKLRERDGGEKTLRVVFGEEEEACSA